MTQGDGAEPCSRRVIQDEARSFGGIWIHLDPVLDLVLCLGFTPSRIGMGICPDIFLSEKSGMIFLASFVKY